MEFANIGVLNKMMILDAKPFMNSRVSEFNTFYIIANVCSTPREDLKKKNPVFGSGACFSLGIMHQAKCHKNISAYVGKYLHSF